MPDWLFWTIGGIIAASGLTLLAWSLFWDRSRARRRCPKCWYDMSGAPTLQCPECGKTAAAETKLLKTRRHWRWAILACLILIAGGGTAGTPKLNRDGPFAFIPTSTLNWFASHFDEQAQELYTRESAAKGGKTTRLSPWERVLVARGAAIKMSQFINTDPEMADLRMLAGWMAAARLVGNEVRLIEQPLTLWVADIEHPRHPESMLVIWSLAQETRPMPGLAPVLAEQAQNTLQSGDKWSPGTIRTLAVNDPGGRRAIPLAMRVLHSDLHPINRMEAIEALAVFIGQDKQALAAIVDAVSDLTEAYPGSTDNMDNHRNTPLLQGRVCNEALIALMAAGSAAAPALPRLEQLAEEIPELRDQIEQTISAIRANMESGK